jgi:hypothetical protein
MISKKAFLFTALFALMLMTYTSFATAQKSTLRIEKDIITSQIPTTSVEIFIYSSATATTEVAYQPFTEWVINENLIKDPAGNSLARIEVDFTITETLRQQNELWFEIVLDGTLLPGRTQIKQDGWALLSDYANYADRAGNADTAISADNAATVGGYDSNSFLKITGEPLQTIQGDIVVQGSIQGALADNQQTIFSYYNNGGGNSSSIPTAPSITNSNMWEIFDPQADPSWVASCTNNDPNSWAYGLIIRCGGFNGAAFDGRYVYSYSGGGYLVRYDTTKPYTNISSWDKFEMSSVAPDETTTDLQGNLITDSQGNPRYFKRGFFSLYYLNGKIYMSPDARSDNQSPYNPYVSNTWAVYDTTKPFNNANGDSYEINKLATGGSGHIRGLCSDGRYIYGTPFQNDTAVRLDPQGAFTDPASWILKDMKGTNGIPGNTGDSFLGCTYSDNTLVFTPYSQYSNNFVKFDTRLDFTNNESWSVYNAHVVDGLILEGYHGGCETPRYSFYAPYGNGTGDGDACYEGELLRRDKTKAFNEPSAWEAFDLEGPNNERPLWGGFWGCTYDGGNHIYLTPHMDEGLSSEVVSYDITKPFKDISSYESIELFPNGANNEKRYTGSVFANGYIYMFGMGGGGRNGHVIRFKAGAPIYTPLANGLLQGDTTIDGDTTILGTINASSAIKVNGADVLTSYTETDPEVGIISTNSVPKWDGSALVTGTIFDNGNVGIGTSTPTGKLDVYGDICFSGDCRTTWPTGSGTGAFTDTGSSASYLGGDVGIGTSSPLDRLHVVKSGSSETGINLTAVLLESSIDHPGVGGVLNNDGVSLEFKIGSSDVQIPRRGIIKYRMSDENSGVVGDLVLGVTKNDGTQTEMLTLNGLSKNVGIGTTNTPTEKLEVSGNIKSSGYIQLGTSAGIPTDACTSADHVGRMKVDSANSNLYICTAGGWITK